MKSASKKSLLVFCLMTWLSLTAVSQSKSSSQPDLLIYGFVAPGTTNLPDSRREKSGKHTDVAIGGGLEKFAWRRFSFGGEAAITPYERDLPLRSVAFEPPVFWIQFNGTYHLNFGNTSKHFVPFASAGVGLTSFAASGVDSGWNYGAGFHLWTKGRLGARIEYRKIIEPVGAFRGGRFSTIRFGVAIR